MSNSSDVAEACTFGTFNLLNFTQPPNASYQPQMVYKPKDWEKKGEWIIRQLKRMHADVVGFQEVFDPVTLKLLAQQAGFAHFAVVDMPRRRVGFAHVFDRPIVAIAAKYPIIDAKVLPVVSDSKTLPDSFPVSADFQFSRTPLLVSVKLPNLGVTNIVVLHLKSPRAVLAAHEIQPFYNWFGHTDVDPAIKPPHWPTGSLAEQGSVLSAWQRAAEAVLVHHAVRMMDEPVVILGDLNDHLQSPSGQALLHGHANFIAMGVSSEAVSSPPTLHNAAALLPNAQVYPTYYHRGEPLYLDYILLNQKLMNRCKVTDYRVHNRHLARSRKGSIRKSDHAQVVATLHCN